MDILGLFFILPLACCLGLIFTRGTKFHAVALGISLLAAIFIACSLTFCLQQSCAIAEAECNGAKAASFLFGLPAALLVLGIGLSLRKLAGSRNQT